MGDEVVEGGQVAGEVVTKSWALGDQVVEWRLGHEAVMWSRGRRT